MSDGQSEIVEEVKYIYSSITLFLTAGIRSHSRRSCLLETYTNRPDIIVHIFLKLHDLFDRSDLKTNSDKRATYKNTVS